jgi:HK97 family phage major capsid protein
MDIKKLNEEKLAAFNKAKSLLDTAKSEERDLTQEEQVKYDGLLDKCDKIAEDVTRLTRAADIEKSLEVPVKEEAKPEIRSSGVEVTSELHPTNTVSYKKAFWKSLIEGRHSLTPAENRALTEGSATAGGNLVPTEYNDKLALLLEQENVMRKLVKNRLVINKADIDLPYQSNHPSAAAVEGEGDALTGTDPTFGSSNVSLFKYAETYRVSNELMSDSVVNLDEYLINRIGMSIAKAEERVQVNGAGTTEPLGVFGELSAASTTIASASAVTYAELIDILYEVPVQYRAGAKFLMHDDMWKIILKSVDDAAGDPASLIGYNVIDPVNRKILGHDVLLSPYAPNTFGLSDPMMVVGHFDHDCTIVDHSEGMKLLRSDHVFFSTDEVGIRGVKRSGFGMQSEESFALINRAAV